MSVGLLLVTHDQIGSILLATVERMLGASPLRAATLAVPPEPDPDALRGAARTLLAELDTGEGVLVLTDLYGGTPSNVAAGLADPGRVRVVAGVNLPMLVRIFNYPHLDLPALGDKALSGGVDGVRPGGVERVA